MYQCSAAAAQRVCGLQAGDRALPRAALLRRVAGIVDGRPQQVVQAAVSPVIMERSDFQHI